MTATNETTELGRLYQDKDHISLDVYRYVMQDGKETGFVKRERMRKASEVFHDLLKALDLIRCDKCGHEKPRSSGWGADCKEHKKCGGQYHWVIDEYFHGADGAVGFRKDFVIPEHYTHVVSFPTTGGNEGHYWHVGVFDMEPERRGPVVYHEIAMGKTFRGWDYCCEMANRCARLLGA